MKIVLNKCFGGFGLSQEQAEAYGIDESELLDGVYYGGYHIERNDPKLVEVVEMDLPGAYLADLRVVEIPDSAFWHIDDYDGVESLTWSESEIHYA